MVHPFFYSDEIGTSARQFVLNEETSKHIVQVLRMQNGEQVQLTDGKGNLFTAAIADANKRKCVVTILSTAYQSQPANKAVIAISFVKNAHRFEWFLEKVTEIGISEVVPLICSRTEKQHFRADRMKGILVSAMLQSQQSWLPFLHEPVKYNEYIKQISRDVLSKKFIAHCKEDEIKKQLFSQMPFTSSVLLIGPEGDFTIDEIELALQNKFIPVSLGNTRLRTETAGVVGATILALG